MADHRKYPRYSCKIKSEMDVYEGNPDEFDIDLTVPVSCKGYILDISRGGAYIITDQRVSVKSTVRIKFKTKKEKRAALGKIVRTGLLKNNPTEIAMKFAKHSAKGDSYVAVEFSMPLPELTEKDF